MAELFGYKETRPITSCIDVASLRHNDAVAYACHNQTNRGLRHAPGCKADVDDTDSMQACTYTHTRTHTHD